MCAFGAGLVSGAAYWLKYSTLLVSAGVYAALMLHGWRNRTPWRRVILPVAAGAVVPVMVLSVANSRPGGAINLLDFPDIDRLAAQSYRGPVSICALLPARSETDGEGDAIRRSFRDITHWRAVSVPEALDTLGVGTRAVTR